MQEVSVLLLHLPTPVSLIFPSQNMSASDLCFLPPRRAIQIALFSSPTRIHHRFLHRPRGKRSQLTTSTQVGRWEEEHDEPEVAALRQQQLQEMMEM